MSREAVERFACFGGTCEVRVAGEHGRAAAVRARERLLLWHRRFTRFEQDSELLRLNADPRAEVPASDTMLALVGAISAAGERTGGLVDGTLAREIEAAGYTRTRSSAVPAGAGGAVVMTRRTGGRVVARRRDGGDVPPALPLAATLRLGPERRPAGPSPHAYWRALVADRRRGVVRRPPSVAIDAGGLAKGLFADLLADELAAHPGYVVNCAGDLRLNGPQARALHVANPFGDGTLHTFERKAGAAATSGIGARAWVDETGAPAHHLFDPATGRPAFTGVVQATALAPTALEAEIRAKAALLGGRARARAWLEPQGGVVVHDDVTHDVVAA
jgi:FAD:protein FMN transferase